MIFSPVHVHACAVHKYVSIMVMVLECETQLHTDKETLPSVHRQETDGVA